MREGWRIEDELNLFESRLLILDEEEIRVSGQRSAKFFSALSFSVLAQKKETFSIFAFSKYPLFKGEDKRDDNGERSMRGDSLTFSEKRISCFHFLQN